VSDDLVYVEVVSFVDDEHYRNGEVVKRMGPMSEWKAEKVEGGLLINLNYEKFFTRVVPS
jgi:hypothetical protein